MLGFKFQLLHRMEGFYVYSTINVFTTIQHTKTISLWRIKGLYSALRPVLKVNQLNGTESFLGN
jgi:hypothetical protein